MNRRLATISAISAVSVLGVTAAQTLPYTLKVEHLQVVRVQQQGKTVEQLTPVSGGVRPGDTLVERVTLTTGKTVKPGRYAVRLPVPNGTTFSGDATPGGTNATLEFSADGGKTFAAEPLTRTVTTQENGKAVTRRVVVAPNEYTTARWVLRDLTPDTTLRFSFRVRVK